LLSRDARVAWFETGSVRLRSSLKPGQRPAHSGRRHPELARDRPPTLATFPQSERTLMRELASRRAGTTPVSVRRGYAGTYENLTLTHVEAARAEHARRGFRRARGRAGSQAEYLVS